MRIYHNMNHILLRIEEMSESKKSSIDRIRPFALGMLTHLGKIYIKSERSNWFGTVRKQITNISRVNFNNYPTATQYFRYIYSNPIHSGLPWNRTPIYTALEYKGHRPTHEEFVDFEYRVQTFTRYVSHSIADKNWNVDDHKTEIDEELRRLFLDKKEV